MDHEAAEPELDERADVAGVDLPDLEHLDRGGHGALPSSSSWARDSLASFWPAAIIGRRQLSLR